MFAYGTSSSPRMTYRELLLNEAGEYQQRIHVKLPPAHVIDPSRTVWIASDPVTPLRRGTPLAFIPFTFINARGLSPHVEQPPLVDLADVVLSHYRSSADREHALHYTAAPTPWVAGSKGTGPLKIGSSIAWDLETDGKAGMLEFSGQGVSAIKDVMAEKRALMAVLGAKLLEEAPSVNETAAAVGMRHSGAHAALRTIAQVIEQGLSLSLRQHAWWMGTDGKPADTRAGIELTKDFFNVRMTADELRAQVLALQADAISYATFYANITRGEMTRPGVSADEEQQAIVRQPSEPRPAEIDHEHEEIPT